MDKRNLVDGKFLCNDPILQMAAHVIMLPVSIVKNPGMAESIDKLYVSGSFQLIEKNYNEAYLLFNDCEHEFTKNEIYILNSPGSI